MYNTNRRLNGANLEAMRLLSKSDPRINLSASVVNLATTDNLIYNGPAGSSRRTSDTMMRSELGHLGEFSFRARRFMLTDGEFTGLLQ